MSQSGRSTPSSSLSSSAVLDELERNGLYLGIDQHGDLVNSARIGLEENFRTRLTTWFHTRSPISLSSGIDEQGEEKIKIKVDALVRKFDFTMRCKDDDRESMLRDMLDLAKMTSASIC